MKKIFQAGKYYVGDPCYAIKDENWAKVGEETGWFGSDYENPKVAEKYSGIFYYQDQKCFADETKWGDGEYLDQYGNRYLVDAGMLGILPIEVCDGDSMNGGNIINFETSFEVKYDDGLFKFGHIEIETDDSKWKTYDEEDDYYEDEYDSDEEW